MVHDDKRNNKLLDRAKKNKIKEKKKYKITQKEKE